MYEIILTARSSKLGGVQQFFSKTVLDSSPTSGFGQRVDRRCEGTLKHRARERASKRFAAIR